VYASNRVWVRVVASARTCAKENERTRSRSRERLEGVGERVIDSTEAMACKHTHTLTLTRTHKFKPVRKSESTERSMPESMCACVRKMSVRQRGRERKVVKVVRERKVVGPGRASKGLSKRK